MRAPHLQTSGSTFKEFRQGAVGKTANTDRDLGLIEKTNQEGEIDQLSKGDKAINLQDAESDLQRIYENAYQHAGGSDARLAMQHITTSGSLESYKDLVVTQLNNPDFWFYELHPKRVKQ